MENINIKNIGSGMGARIIFSKTTKSTYVCTGMEKINDSIYMILNTAKGEIPMLPEFGSRLPYLLFEDSNENLEDLIEVYIREDLEEQEPRISVTNVIISGITEDTIPVTIEYVLTNTNIAGKLEYSIAKNL